MKQSYKSNKKYRKSSFTLPSMAEDAVNGIVEYIYKYFRAVFYILIFPGKATKDYISSHNDFSLWPRPFSFFIVSIFIFIKVISTTSAIDNSTEIVFGSNVVEIFNTSVSSLSISGVIASTLPVVLVIVLISSLFSRVHQKVPREKTGKTRSYLLTIFSVQVNGIVFAFVLSYVITMNLYFSFLSFVYLFSLFLIIYAGFYVPVRSIYVYVSNEYKFVGKKYFRLFSYLMVASFVLSVYVVSVLDTKLLFGNGTGEMDSLVSVKVLENDGVLDVLEISTSDSNVLIEILAANPSNETIVLFGKGNLFSIDYGSEQDFESKESIKRYMSNIEERHVNISIESTHKYIILEPGGSRVLIYSANHERGQDLLKPQRDLYISIPAMRYVDKRMSYGVLQVNGNLQNPFEVNRAKDVEQFKNIFKQTFSHY